MTDVDINLFVDLLNVGTLGLVIGCALPFAFRIVGAAIDVVRQILE